MAHTLNQGPSGLPKTNVFGTTVNTLHYRWLLKGFVGRGSNFLSSLTGLPFRKHRDFHKDHTMNFWQWVIEGKWKSGEIGKRPPARQSLGVCFPGTRMP
jgi:hypothetical protein